MNGARNGSFHQEITKGLVSESSDIAVRIAFDALAERGILVLQLADAGEYGRHEENWRVEGVFVGYAKLFFWSQRLDRSTGFHGAVVRQQDVRTLVRHRYGRLHRYGRRPLDISVLGNPPDCLKTQ